MGLLMSLYDSLTMLVFHPILLAMTISIHVHFDVVIGYWTESYSSLLVRRVQISLSLKGYHISLSISLVLLPGYYFKQTTSVKRKAGKLQN